MKSYDTQLNLELEFNSGRIDALLSDKGSMEEFMATDNGKDVAFMAQVLAEVLWSRRLELVYEKLILIS